MAKKQFGLIWAFEAFENMPSFFSKRMFGGLAAYLHDKMVLVLVENPGDKEYRNKKFDFDIWNGVLLPTEREFHQSLKQDYPNLIQHPVLGKWLYLPMDSEEFEESLLKISEFIASKDPRFGVFPKNKEF